MTFIEEMRAWVGTGDFWMLAFIAGAVAVGTCFALKWKREIREIDGRLAAEAEARTARTGFVWHRPGDRK